MALPLDFTNAMDALHKDDKVAAYLSIMRLEWPESLARFKPKDYDRLPSNDRFDLTHYASVYLRDMVGHAVEFKDGKWQKVREA